MSAPDELWGVIDDNGHPVMVRVSEQRVREYVALTKDVIGMTYEVVRYVRAPTAPQGAEPVAWLYSWPSGSVACAETERIENPARNLIETPLYAAPQGAEIAREPTAAMIVEGTKELAHVIANDVTGKASHIWRAMYDAALTPTDAETKG